MVLCFFVLLLSYWWVSRSTSSSSSLPVAPNAWPLIGHFPLVLRSKSLMKALTTARDVLRRKGLSGAVYEFRIFSRKLVIVTDESMFAKIWAAKTEDLDFWPPQVEFQRVFGALTTIWLGAISEEGFRHRS